MSAAWSRYIRENFREWSLSSTAAHLLDTLACYANAEGFAWPGSDELAARMRVSRSTVKRARAELRATGVLVITAGDGRGRATVYALPSSAIKGIIRDPLSMRERGSPVNERGSSTTRKGVTGDPPRSIEGSKKGPRVTVVNGFALEPDEPVADLDRAREVFRANLAPHLRDRWD